MSTPECSDDFVATLKREAQSLTAVLHDFLLSPKEAGVVHVFFEGSDDKLYYMTELRRKFNGKQIFPYVCNGKKTVIDIKNKISKEKKHIQYCLFFVDRDHDDIMHCQPNHDSNLYITDYYSIENHLVSNESIEITLVEFAHIDKNNPAYGEIHKNVSAYFKRFYKHMLTFMSWVICMRESNNKLNLNNANFSNVLKFENGGGVYRKPGAFKTFRKSVTVDNKNIDKDRFKYWLQQLKHIDEKCWVRGKYELWFFEKILLKEIKNQKDRDRQKISTPAFLMSGGTFEALGARVSPPKSLQIFLHNAEVP